MPEGVRMAETMRVGKTDCPAALVVRRVWIW
jgi:hypothetical protein